MRARFNELKKDCDDQTLAHEKSIAEKDKTILELKTRLGKQDEEETKSKDARILNLQTKLEQITESLTLLANLKTRLSIVQSNDVTVS